MIRYGLVVDGIPLTICVNDSINDSLVEIFDENAIRIWGCHYENMPFSQWTAGKTKTVLCNSDTFTLLCEYLEKLNNDMGVSFDTNTPTTFRLN